LACRPSCVSKTAQRRSCSYISASRAFKRWDEI